MERQIDRQIVRQREREGRIKYMKGRKKFINTHLSLSLSLLPYAFSLTQPSVPSMLLTQVKDKLPSFNTAATIFNTSNCSSCDNPNTSKARCGEGTVSKVAVVVVMVRLAQVRKIVLVIIDSITIIIVSRISQVRFKTAHPNYSLQYSFQNKLGQFRFKTAPPNYSSLYSFQNMLGQVQNSAS